jgi:outer membrane protein TolC
LNRSRRIDLVASTWLLAALLTLPAVAQTALQADRSNVALQRQNVDVLKVAQRKLRREVEAGVLNHTDEAQVAAQLAAARSALYAAESQYNASKAAYLAAIGVEPGSLASPHVRPTATHRKK